MSKKALIVLCLLLMGACSSPEITSPLQTPSQPALINAYTLPGQKLPPATIRSIELFRLHPGTEPVLRLGSQEQLTLQFDELARSSNQFRVEFTHHNYDWSQSNLIPNQYIRGFMNDFIQGGSPGRFQNPQWFAYEYTFPNEQLRLLLPGNYMIHVYRQENSEKLFSMPFLVAQEDDDRLDVQAETLYNTGSGAARSHQLFATYRYEDPSVLPRNDLSIVFVQNQFWSRFKVADQADFSRDGVGRLYLSRAESFHADESFLQLDLGSIENYSMQVVDFDQDQRIPRITLLPDVLAFLNFGTGGAVGEPASGPNARYALVRFQLDPPSGINAQTPLYLVGSFNNWGISPQYRLREDSVNGLLSTTAVLKEGRYAYQYVTLQDRTVNSTPLMESQGATVQEYIALVYRRDQNLQADVLAGWKKIRVSN